MCFFNHLLNFAGVDNRANIKHKTTGGERHTQLVAKYKVINIANYFLCAGNRVVFK